MDLILLNEMELIKAKTQYSTVIARQKAAYDNSLDELDLYTNFIDEMAVCQEPDIPINDKERDNYRTDIFQSGRNYWIDSLPDIFFESFLSSDAILS